MRRLAILALLAACDRSEPATLGSSTLVGDGGSTTRPSDAAVESSTTNDASTGGELVAGGEHRPSLLRASTSTFVWVRDDPADAAVVQGAPGSAPQVLTKGLSGVEAMRVDDAHAWVLAQGGLRAVALDGSGSTTVLAIASPSPVRDLALGASYVFYTEGPNGKLKRVPKAGGASDVVATGLVGPTSIAVDEPSAWVVESGESGALVAIALGTGTTTVIASNLREPHDVAVNDDAVFWIESGTFDPQSQKTTGAGVMTQKRGGGPTSVLAPTEGANHLHVTGSWVYFTAGTSVLRVPAAGGALEILASGVADPSGVVTQGGWVAWANRGTGDDGSVRRRTE